MILLRIVLTDSLCCIIIVLKKRVCFWSTSKAQKPGTEYVPFASSCSTVYLFDWSFRISCSVCWYLSDQPPIFHPQDFPSHPSPERPPLPILCATQEFWVFSLWLGLRLRLSCQALWLVELNPFCSVIGQIWLRREECRSRRRCALARCSHAYLCLHSHRQPAQVLTLGGDY